MTYKEIVPVEGTASIIVIPVKHYSLTIVIYEEYEFTSIYLVEGLLLRPEEVPETSWEFERKFEGKILVKKVL